MNSSPTQDSAEESKLEKLRQQLSTDMEAMQEKEASLREYEQRLRLLVEHAHPANPAPAPTVHTHRYYTTGPDQGSIDAAWEKYNRAHALLEAARRGLADDRLLLKEREEHVTVREQEVARREAWVKVREQELAALAMPAPIKAQARASGPFAAARKLLSKGKAS
jgi:hypothetical protein